MGGLTWDTVSSCTGLLTLATASIYAGAFGSLPNPKPQAGSPKSDDDEEEEDNAERVSSGDAWLFPVVGSVVLFGLYIVVNYFGKEWINWFLGLYFSVAGIGSVWKSSISLTRFILGDKRWKQYDRTTFLIKKGSAALLSLSCRTPSLLLFPLAIVPSALYTFSSASRKSAILTDLLSISFSFNSMTLLKIDSFKTGTILLSGLFFYDIWWVFGTDVMLSVATNLDVPIKLLWSKSLSFSGADGYSMLGLGDVIIPGTFVTLALRYDYHRSTISNSPASPSFSKPYFYASLIAYFLGLLTTMIVMHFFQKAQPALLYLSPACILSFFITAVIRGELKDAWAWNDDPAVGEAAVTVAKAAGGVQGLGDSTIKPADDRNWRSQIDESVKTGGDGAGVKSRKKKNL